MKEIEQNCVFFSDIDMTQNEESDSEYSKLSDCYKVWSFKEHD